MKKSFQTLGLISVVFILNYLNVFPGSKSLQHRIKMNINEGWEYLENNSQEEFSISKLQGWQDINLPHTWNQWDAMDQNPGYRRDASWYKKEIFIDNFIGADYILYFEGINISSVIYINGNLAGKHVGGYIGFEIDISAWVKKDSKNTICIRVDNGYDPDIIPSQKADFFIYGGITRDVWLKILPKNHITSIKISTPIVSKLHAETNVKINLNNIDILNKNTKLKFKIIDLENDIVVIEKKYEGKELIEEPFVLPILNNPKLWSPDQPHLYRMEAFLLNEDDSTLDSLSENFGYRFYEFVDHGPFLLNGERLLLRGTHRHEEHAGYGAAMPNELHKKDIKLMKEMGVNFLRLGHYPQDPIIYKTCDELGIIVWDELPWCRGGIGGDKWQSNTKDLLKAQINQNYNHPSVFFWSLGNEINWLPDFENGDDPNQINSFIKTLNSIAHNLDPYRLTAIRKYYEGADLVDVFSPSIWSGWYGGIYTNYESTLKKNLAEYPHFLHMEYGGSSHVGRHSENPISGKGILDENEWTEQSNQVNVQNIAANGDWSENYIVDLFDWHLSVSEQMVDFAGNAQWAFKDFGTPLRPENAIPYMNQKGLVDRDGKPKDAYYVFKSYWSEDPFVYIESKTWTERTGPIGKPRNISVFSNCDKVELLHNGISKSTKKRNLGSFPACGLNWDINFEEGNNQLIAIGYKNGKIIQRDSLTIHYSYQKSEKADHIQLSSKTLENGNELIEAVMLDKNGQRVLDYEKPIYFAKDGSGKLMVNYGTPNRSQVIQMANGKASIEFIPDNGKTVIEARNQDFKGSYLVLEFNNKQKT